MITTTMMTPTMTIRPPCHNFPALLIAVCFLLNSSCTAQCCSWHGLPFSANIPWRRSVAENVASNLFYAFGVLQRTFSSGIYGKCEIGHKTCKAVSNTQKAYKGAVTGYFETRHWRTVGGKLRIINHDKSEHREYLNLISCWRYGFVLWAQVCQYL